jgi:cysteine desulfurase
VLVAMGVPEDDARGALRFSLGRTSTAADVAVVAKAIGPVVERARRAGLAARAAV